MKELFIKEVTTKMADFLDGNQRIKLREILTEICLNYQIEIIEQTKRQETQKNNTYILDRFIASDENLEKLRDTCSNVRDLAILELLISTGMRVGELTRLNISDMNFQERSCIVLGKGNSEREVYFSAKSKMYIEKYLETRTDDNEALFVSLIKPYSRLGISGIETAIRI